MIGTLVIPPVGSDSLPPDQTSDLTQTLDDFNSGVTGPGKCGPTAVEPTTWSHLKASYR